MSAGNALRHLSVALRRGLLADDTEFGLDREDRTHQYAMLTEFVAYPNTERPHRSLALTPPCTADPAGPASHALPGRPRTRSSALGGLYHLHECAA